MNLDEITSCDITLMIGQLGQGQVENPVQSGPHVGQHKGVRMQRRSNYFGVANPLLSWRFFAVASCITLIFMTAGGAPHSALAKDNDSTSVEQVNRSAIKSTVHRFLKSWETNDRKTFAAMLSEDAKFAYPGDRLTKAEAVAMFEQYQSEKSDIRIYLWDQFFVSGERFATAYQFAATDRKTGKRQAVGTGITGKIKNGKIALFKEYYDEEVAVRQYEGKLPLDEGQVSPWPRSVWLRPETID